MELDEHEVAEALVERCLYLDKGGALLQPTAGQGDVVLGLLLNTGTAWMWSSSSGLAMATRKTATRREVS